MHILLLPSWYPSNSEDVKGVFFRDQALALASYGHTVGVIAPILRSLRKLFDGDVVSPILGFEMDLGLPTYRREVFGVLPRVPYGNYWLFKKAARSLLRYYIKRHGKPDIIHAHSAIFGGAAAVAIASEYGIPVVLTEHSSGFARNRYARWQLNLARKGISGACRLIAVSPSLGAILGKMFPLSKNQWHWVPNVVADRFTILKKGRDERDSTIFINLALMTANKGQSELIKAFSNIAKTNSTAELWLAGDGPARRGLEKQVSELGISQRVNFLGMVKPSKVPNLIERADVMVVASHYETFGVVAAEALMAGLPVISTRCGGPECIVDNGDGILVPVQNSEALAAAMQEFVENIDSFCSISIAKRAHLRFSSIAVAERLTNEYKQVISMFEMDRERINL